MRISDVGIGGFGKGVLASVAAELGGSAPCEKQLLVQLQCSTCNLEGCSLGIRVPLPRSCGAKQSANQPHVICSRPHSTMPGTNKFLQTRRAQQSGAQIPHVYPVVQILLMHFTRSYHSSCLPRKHSL